MLLSFLTFPFVFYYTIEMPYWLEKWGWLIDDRCSILFYSIRVAIVSAARICISILQPRDASRYLIIIHIPFVLKYKNILQQQFCQYDLTKPCQVEKITLSNKANISFWRDVTVYKHRHRKWDRRKQDYGKSGEQRETCAVPAVPIDSRPCRFQPDTSTGLLGLF